MQINTEVKGTLARLLATENLTVEHRRVSTASFDVNNRVLVLPIWNTASGTVYDLLVGHEVGHALYTPNKDTNAPKSFVNVVEDARIERMMKVTYPGLRRSFFEGYRELWHKDFFGVADKDPNELALIDRINLYFKGSNDIEFNDVEQVFVNRASTTNTFEEVEQLAQELYNYAQSLEDEKEKTNSQFPTPEQNDLDLDANLDLPQDTDEQEEITPDNDGDQEFDGMTDEELLDALEDRMYEDDLKTETGGGEDVVDETKCETDDALQEALETLVDPSDREWVYLDIPKIELDEVIIPHTEVHDDLEKWFASQVQEGKTEENLYYSWKRIGVKDAVDAYLQYKKDAQKSVNYLVKQFEMKKSADEYQKAAVSKTGVIDTNSLFKYKLTDDIFKRNTIIPEGKNHGLVLFVDWSGSMHHRLLDTIKQTYNLVWFCRKAGIPFRVYGFQNTHHNSTRIHTALPDAKENSLALCTDFKLIELVSSRQNAKSLDNSLKVVWNQVYAMQYNGLPHLDKYTLGGTPLAEAILCSRQIVDQLKLQENVTKVNVVCLTDGEANPMQYLRKGGSYYEPDTDELFTSNISYCRNVQFVLRDAQTGYTKQISSSPYETTKEIVSFFNDITNYNWIGIRICTKGELKRVLRELSYEAAEVADKNWKKHRFCSIKNIVGFSESFYMPESGTGEGTHELEIKQKGEVATRAELGRAFKKHMGSKMNNKTILNAFIEQIA